MVSKGEPVTDRDMVRDQIARALDSVLAAASTSIGRITPNQLADAVMVIVGPIVAEREKAHADLGALRQEIEELRNTRDDVVWCVARDAPSPRCIERVKCDLALWLHAEAAWQRDEAARSARDSAAYAELGWAATDQLRVALSIERESRFRWAEEAAECERRVERERFRAGMLRSAVVRELHVLADRDELSTHDIHTLADHIEAGDWLEGDPGPVAAPVDRESLGRLVRKVWIGWASEQPNPKPSWLVPWEDLSEPDREVDRRIGETLARAGISAGLVARTPSDLQVPPSLGETAPNPLCEKCRCRGVQYPDRPSSVFGHFCLTCIGKCHDMSDESSVHMCVIDRWEPARGTGTEADNAQ